MSDLNRFTQAQKSDYEQAKKEIQQGKKTSHWIWYIFPQIKSLGKSADSKFYGIADFEEACNYLRHPTLFPHYVEMVKLVEQHLDSGNDLVHLMGSSTDAYKLISSVTLFRATAAFLKEEENATPEFAALELCCDHILERSKQQNFSPCAETLDFLQKNIPTPSKGAKAPIQTIPEPVAVIPTTKASSEPQDPSLNSIPASTLSMFQPVVKNPLNPSSINWPQLQNKLEGYIDGRKKEWSFHYNFLGLVALVYLIQDFFCKTNFYNNKSRNTKISAAEKLKSLDADVCATLTPAEQAALQEGRLGRLISEFGGLELVIKELGTDQEPGPQP